VPSSLPSLARSLLTVLLSKFAVHMLAPSNATLKGNLPTGKVPSNLPSFVRTLVTVLPPVSVTHTWKPSNAIPDAKDPGSKRLIDWLTSYHFRSAICCGFNEDLVTPLFAATRTPVDAASNGRERTVNTSRRMDFNTAHLLSNETREERSSQSRSSEPLFHWRI